VLFAKITPAHIEATCFALLTSMGNLSAIVGSMVGAQINDHFIGVTKDDLEHYWKLNAITHMCSIFPVIFAFCLLPTIPQI
jgi:hypothetical protein